MKKKCDAYIFVHEKTISIIQLLINQYVFYVTLSTICEVCVCVKSARVSLFLIAHFHF